MFFFYSGDFSGKPGAGEVNRKVAVACNWETSFRKWHWRFKLGFINSASITKMFNLTLKMRKTTNRVMYGVCFIHVVHFWSQRSQSTCLT